MTLQARSTKVELEGWETEAELLVVRMEEPETTSPAEPKGWRAEANPEAQKSMVQPR